MSDSALSRAGSQKGVLMLSFKSAIALSFSGAMVLAYAPAAMAAEEFAPYGTATVSNQKYAPLKYVVESSAFDPAELANTLRATKQILSLSPTGNRSWLS